MTYKVFDLSCESGHVFEGWFGSNDEYEAQLSGGRIECPMCGSVAIRRRPSAPMLNLGSGSNGAAKRPDAARLQAMVFDAARRIAAGSEDVGERFAEEARRIHYKEAPERSIRGVATPDEAAALIEEGVEVVALPFGNLAKETLQ
jgi:hypothetical protein